MPYLWTCPAPLGFMWKHLLSLLQLKTPTAALHLGRTEHRWCITTPPELCHMVWRKNHLGCYSTLQYRGRQLTFLSIPKPQVEGWWMLV